MTKYDAIVHFFITNRFSEKKVMEMAERHLNAEETAKIKDFIENYKKNQVNADEN